MIATAISMPPQALPYTLDTSPNIFRERFGALSIEQWRDLLVESMRTQVIGDVEFPRFPPAAIQEQIHGQSGEPAINEAFAVYAFVKSKQILQEKLAQNCSFLDFGTGWGRIVRMFMRDFDLNRIFGFEPQRATCFVARSLNPYLCFLNGEFTPDGTLPANRFDLVVGWSVFSHLSELSTTIWLEEMARVTRPNGYCVFSTWGERFLNTLMSEQNNLAQGKEVHWYYQMCLKAAGDIVAERDRYLNGEFVWFGDDPSLYYGHACFLHPNALLHILQARGIAFELVEFDRKSLAQDVFILRRT